MANKLTVTYIKPGQSSLSTLIDAEISGSAAVTYIKQGQTSDSTIATVAAGSTKVLACAGKLMNSNLVIGGTPLNCAKKKMNSDITITVVSLFPDTPSSYTRHTVNTLPTEIEVDSTGWFKIELYGESGKGGYAYKSGSSVLAKVYGGGAGGGGAYCCSIVKMNAGDSIKFSVTSNGKRTVTINSSIPEQSHVMTVYSAKNGTDASSDGPGVGGDGGTADGGNIANNPGGRGDDGKTGTSVVEVAAGGTAASGTEFSTKGGDGGYYSITGSVDPGSGKISVPMWHEGNTNV